MRKLLTCMTVAVVWILWNVMSRPHSQPVSVHNDFMLCLFNIYRDLKSGKLIITVDKNGFYFLMKTLIVCWARHNPLLHPLKASVCHSVISADKITLIATKTNGVSVDFHLSDVPVSSLCCKRPRLILLWWLGEKMWWMDGILFLFCSSCRSGGEQYSQVDVRERRGLPSRLRQRRKQTL